MDEKNAWAGFRKELAAYLKKMTDDDHLIVAMPEIDDESGLATPYAQFAVASMGDGETDDEVVIRAEISGNDVLIPSFRQEQPALRALARSGWTLPDPEDESPNLHRYAAAGDAGRLALAVSRALQNRYSVPHPTLLSANGWGPSAENIANLGLAPSVFDPQAAELAASAREARELLGVSDEDWTPRHQLVAAVREILIDLYDEFETDEDGDFMLTRFGPPVWVRVLSGLPVIEAFTPVVANVRNRRQAAVEVSLLNRDMPLVKFCMVDRTVMASLQMPAFTLDAKELSAALPHFTEAVASVRSDLAFRTGARS